MNTFGITVYYSQLRTKISNNKINLGTKFFLQELLLQKYAIGVSITFSFIKLA